MALLGHALAGFAFMLRSFRETSFFTECPTMTSRPLLAPFATVDAKDDWRVRCAAVVCAAWAARDLLAGAAWTAAAVVCALLAGAAWAAAGMKAVRRAEAATIVRMLPLPRNGRGTVYHSLADVAESCTPVFATVGARTRSSFLRSDAAGGECGTARLAAGDASMDQTPDTKTEDSAIRGVLCGLMDSTPGARKFSLLPDANSASSQCQWGCILARSRCRCRWPVARTRVHRL